jgi:serine O-acetyltransferase
MTERPWAPELEKAIDGIVKSYDGDLSINNLDSAALPNKRAVVEAFEHICPIIYLGFYSTRALDASNLRQAISQHALPAYERFATQIDRAVRYEATQKGVIRSQDFAHKATLALFQELPVLRAMLNDDAMTAYEHDPAAKSVEEVYFAYPTLKAITAHRVAHLLYREGVPLIPRILSEHAHGQTGIDIHPGAQIGPRFFIDHGTGIVIGETAQLGSDVKLYQGVTLGALSTDRAIHSRQHPAKRHPTLGDHVTVYAGATILGGQTHIGAHSIIGGNVWLIHSVPPGTKIFGRSKDDPEV